MGSEARDDQLTGFLGRVTPGSAVGRCIITQACLACFDLHFIDKPIQMDQEMTETDIEDLVDMCVQNFVFKILPVWKL